MRIAFGFHVSGLPTVAANFLIICGSITSAIRLSTFLSLALGLAALLTQSTGIRWILWMSMGVSALSQSPESESEGEGERREGEEERGVGGGAAATAGQPAKATCPPNRSQAATDKLTCEPSVAPATSTPMRVRIAGFILRGRSATPAGALEPKWL